MDDATGRAGDAHGGSGSTAQSEARKGGRGRSNAARSAILVVALVVASASGARAGDTGPFAPDKLSHFATSFPCGALGTVIVDQFAPDYRLVGGALLGTFPGLVVEIVDSTGTAGFSGGDLLADFVGSALGALITDQVVLRFWFDDKGPAKGGGVSVGGTF
jgi:VanZ family protein